MYDNNTGYVEGVLIMQYDTDIARKREGKRRGKVSENEYQVLNKPDCLYTQELIK